jgi:hypothetical protein
VPALLQWCEDPETDTGGGVGSLGQKLDQVGEGLCVSGHQGRFRPDGVPAHRADLTAARVFDQTTGGDRSMPTLTDGIVPCR